MTTESAALPAGGVGHKLSRGGSISRLGGTVRARLTALGTILGLLLAVVAVIAITGFSSVRSAYSAGQIPEANLAYSTSAYQGWLQADDQTNMFAALAALHDPKQATLMAVTWKQVLQGSAQANRYIGLLEKNHLSAESLVLTMRLSTDLATYGVYTDEMSRLVSGLSGATSAAKVASQTDNAVRDITVDNATASNKVQSDFDALRAQLTSQEHAVGARIPSTTDTRRTLSIVIGIAALLLAAIITVLVIRSITQPLAKVAEAAGEVAAGRVDVELDVHGDDEIGRVADSFRAVISHVKNMARVAETFSTGDFSPEIQPQSEHDVLARSLQELKVKISGILSEISQSSESLSAASTQMASSSEEAGRAIAEIANAVGSVAQGAEQQVRSVDDAKRITDELAEASRVSAETADETAAAAEEARNLAHQGVEAAEQASAAMTAVRDSSAQTTEAIRSLGQKSDQIGGIVATITRIAAQTNLLALNAAIEAARAGEHGRGFAVVAEEVRHLAEESQAAAATIGVLIEEIQHETQRTVEVVELGAAHTRGGVATVEQAREAFLQIGQSVEDMSDRVEQIAASIRQIASSGDQMRASMNSVAAVAESSSASTEEVSASTEQTSASTQEIAASAHQLAATAEQLETLVGQFVFS